MTIFKEVAALTLVGFHEGPLNWIGSWGDVFVEGKKPEEKPSQQGENQQETQLTYCTGSELSQGNISGRRAFSPRHRLAIPAPQLGILSSDSFLWCTSYKSSACHLLKFRHNLYCADRLSNNTQLER